MSDNYIVVSGTLFGLIAAGQAVRALNQWPVIVAGVDVPVWVSWAAAVVMGSLCVWAFRSGRR